MKLGGRVNESSAKKVLAKQLGEFASQLEGAGFLDVKTGKISGKTLCKAIVSEWLQVRVACHVQPRKPKKILTPEKQVMKDMKTAANRR